MNKNVLKSVLLGSTIILGTLGSCSKNDDPNSNGNQTASGPDNESRKYVTLTAAFPDDSTPPVAGNGGTMAYALTLADALDASKTIDIFKDGYGVRSARTARVQGSINGNFLYNIQYTGTNGGVFNKYKVEGGKNFIDTREELNTASILGTSPRWVKAAEGVGIGVNISGAAAPIDPVKAEAGTQTYEYKRGTATVAIIDLNDPKVSNSTEFDFPFSDEDKKAGYSVSRLDVPVLNAAKNKVYIGCAIGKVDPTKPLRKTVNAETNAVTWSWVADAANIRGTVTLVLDYPSLANPTLIWSTKANVGNNSYRTMTQYVGTDGHVYQSTGANTTSYPYILRIDKNTNKYDNNYLFDLGKALSIPTGRVGIKAWTYIKDGKAIAIYDIDSKGGYIALIDLNANTATRIANQYESTLSLTQYQNIVVAGDNAYIPLTPSGLDGQLYVVNWRNGTATPGIKLKNQSGSFFIGSY